jgi:hypothetical protein
MTSALSRNVLVHSCFSQECGDPCPNKCRCRKLVSYEEARYLVKIGEASWMLDYNPYTKKVYEMPDEIICERTAKTPRSNTLESAHMERNAESNEEQIASADAYGELQIGVWDALTRAEIWNEEDDEFRGRAIIVLFDYDLRTHYSGSIK